MMRDGHHGDARRVLRAWACGTTYTVDAAQAAHYVKLERVDSTSHRVRSVWRGTSDSSLFPSPTRAHTQTSSTQPPFASCLSSAAQKAGSVSFLAWREKQVFD